MIASDFFFIDMERLINQSEAGININKKIKQLQEFKTIKIKKNQDNLKKKESDLINQKNIISPELFDKNLLAHKKEINEFRKMRDMERKDFENKKIEYTSKLLNVINPILKDYVKSKNISILLEKKNIILGANEFDITNEIIKILNIKINDIKL
ncbi:OmpH family outer membrane protein [Candidatus Pelagibacter sp. Uisw_113]|uniref:OmpH family outer membrane protein n=1 Tax=Candidatus Pelagibacter sp. Uisw_113 TaxID=3230994 RepID=UPI0039E8143B